MALSVETFGTFPAPDEVEGFWSHDKQHAPRPISPLARELVTDTLAIGFSRAHAQMGASVDMTSRTVNHYLYSSLHPVADPAEAARRAAVYADTLDRALPQLGQRWEQEWKPWLMATVAEGRVVDHRAKTNAELLEELEAQRRHMIEQWTIHGLINFVVVAGARFCDFYDECFAPEDRTEAYQCLQGFATRSVDASRGLWRLSRLVRAEPGLLALWDGRPPREVLAALPGAPGGPGFLDELGRYLDEFGWRSDAVYDVADVTWREDPSIPLAALGGYLALDDDHDPDARFADAVRRREELLADARQRLAGRPERLARFDALYEAARHNNPITEDHAFWIDQCGIANLRRFLLQVGERLVAEGVVDEPSDVFYLTVAEITGGLQGGGPHDGGPHDGGLHGGGDRRAEARSRRAEVALAAGLTPPRTLGRPPAPPSGPLDPLLDALGGRLSGRRPPDPEAPVPGELKGVGASSGTATGTARVVRSLAEASRLAPGDIMVCEMTLPPWVPLFSLVAGVVADTGGIMSHCAIVAREYGVPAVVGTLTGTTTIADGATVTVDGDRGVVRTSVVGAAEAPVILDLR